MFHTYCGGCSNRIDPAKAVIWKRPADGRFLYFCSEECRRVGEEIEPEYACGFRANREMNAPREPAPVEPVATTREE